jgi:hypothetical protein
MCIYTPMCVCLSTHISTPSQVCALLSNTICAVLRLGLPGLVVSLVSLDTAYHNRWFGTIALVRVGQLHVTLVSYYLPGAPGFLWE